MSLLNKIRCSPMMRTLRNFHNQPVMRVGVLDVPFNKGQRKSGVENGPKTLRDSGLIKKLEELPFIDVKDYGAAGYQCEMNPPKVENMQQYEHVISCNKTVSMLVESIIRDGRTCLTLGGDHSIGLGTVSGHCRAKRNKVALLWVDAHADLNTNRTSDTGNMHGMPVSMIIKEIRKFWEQLPGMDWHTHCLSLENVAYIGLRSIDPYEDWLIHKLGITYFDMFHIQRYGIDAVVATALEKIDPYQEKSIHLSFDIDSLDPHDAPSTGTAVPGGLLLREGIYIASACHNTGRLGAMDLVEINPSIGNKDDVDTTVQSATQVVLAAFGNQKRGARPDLPDLKMNP